MSRNTIAGKTVLIAGGAKNLGGLFATDFAEHGAAAIAIHCNSASSKEAADKTVAAMESAGAKAVALQADLTSAGAMDTPIFYPAEGEEAVAYHKTAAALSPFSPTGLTHIENSVPWIRMMVSDGWWLTGQAILMNGGYTPK